MTQVQVENGTAGSDELGDEILCGVQVALYVPPQGMSTMVYVALNPSLSKVKSLTN